MDKLKKLKIHLYADGADLNSIKILNNNPLVKGFTTNPSLMKSVGVTNYKEFAEQILNIVNNKPISFEVFSDNLAEMEKQALQISKYQLAKYIKI